MWQSPPSFLSLHLLIRPLWFSLSFIRRNEDETHLVSSQQTHFPWGLDATYRLLINLCEKSNWFTDHKGTETFKERKTGLQRSVESFRLRGSKLKFIYSNLIKCYKYLQSEPESLSSNLSSSFWCEEQGRQGKCQKNYSSNDCNYGNKTRKQMSVKQRVSLKYEFSD